MSTLNGVIPSASEQQTSSTHQPAPGKRKREDSDALDLSDASTDRVPLPQSFLNDVLDFLKRFDTVLLITSDAFKS